MATQLKMRRFKQEKLWRDKLPNRMEQEHGSIIHIKQLNDNEFDSELRIKLLEEAKEVQTAQSLQELKEELADLYEVIDTIVSLNNISKEDIIALQTKKRDERGGFAERKYVTFAEHQEGSFGQTYCLEQPNKYPEII